jgi:hypothetical protein
VDSKHAACPACCEADRLGKKRHRDNEKAKENNSMPLSTPTIMLAATPACCDPLSQSSLNVEQPSAEPDSSSEEEKPSLKRRKVSTWWCTLPISSE